MSLLVEVAGFGICHGSGSDPYSVMVICVQQESFQAWTVYRRQSQFSMLADQLRALYPTIVPLPNLDASILNHDNLEGCRQEFNRWLQLAGKNHLFYYIIYYSYIYYFIFTQSILTNHPFILLSFAVS
jgi:hypothetical protein